MWMSREEATKFWMENKYGEGVDCVIAEHEVTCYSNDECFELDEFYQFGVKADGTILQFYYEIDDTLAPDEQDDELWEHPTRIEDATDFYSNEVDAVIMQHGEGLRTLEDVVKGMEPCNNKKELESFLANGGFVYEEDDEILQSDGTLSMYWKSDSALREEYNHNFGAYARAAAVRCLQIIGMTEDEIANELESWDFPSEVPEHE